MRIVVWGINYAPEQIGIAPCNVALCEFLARKKCDVTMLTSFPYYPGWKKKEEDSAKIFAAETINGVRVLRCWHYVPGKLNTAKRVLHELSFVLCSFFRALFLPKPDLWIVVSPPLLSALAIRLICLFKGGRYLLHLQDLQPDAAINLGMIRSVAMIRVLRAAESAAYDGAWRISVITTGMKDVLCQRGVDQEKLFCFPNGTYPMKCADRGKFRQEHGIDRESFLVLHSGNIGVKQGLEHLIASVRFVSNRRFQLLICGEGAEKTRLLAVANGMRNVRFVALREADDYGEMLADADLMIVSLASSSGNSFFPSKLFSACAAGKAIVAICDLNSELAQLVDKAGCGAVAPYGDRKALAKLFDQLAQNQERLDSMSEAARQLSKLYAWDALLEKFTQDVKIS
jgi:colanic acid biosynthesis glycosyl transferase WcaI